ncbi:hypothetical protein JRQ81_014211, partial [Phrynocephalus forsythii]
CPHFLKEDAMEPQERMTSSSQDVAVLHNGCFIWSKEKPQNPPSAWLGPNAIFLFLP